MLVLQACVLSSPSLVVTRIGFDVHFPLQLVMVFLTGVGRSRSAVLPALLRPFMEPACTEQHEWAFGIAFARLTTQSVSSLRFVG